MNADQRARLLIVIREGILVRRGEMIDTAVADERARNLTTIVEIMCRDFRDEATQPGAPPAPPTVCPQCDSSRIHHIAARNYFCASCSAAFDGAPPAGYSPF